MITYNYAGSFPSQVVPDAEKQTMEYGYAVGRAIEGEWFSGDRGGMGNRYQNSWLNFHRLRLYARGEQPVQKYKDELAVNGDLSYLNLDWKPVPIIPKFVDIIVNGMSQRIFDIKAFAQDPESLKQRTKYADAIMRDMYAKEMIQATKEATGLDFFNSADPNNIPETQEDLDLHMQLSYKQSIEIAEEEAIDNVLQANKYELVKRRVIEDLTVIGIGATKTTFNLANGIDIDYVDPANLVYSYTDDPNFEDIYYVGEVKSMSLVEVKKQFPWLTDQELEVIQKYPGDANYTRNFYAQQDSYNQVQVLYFEYKTYSNQVFKIKQTEQGLEKALEKPDSFNPPVNDNFERVGRAIEVLYSGAKILGHEMMLEWKLAENMTRPNSNVSKVNMNYCICAPKLYKGMIESTVSRITGFADMIQLTHLKLQQVLSRMVPDGVFVDVDGLAEVDLGNGTNYNPAEALNMYFQTGSIVGRSMTQEGDINRGKVPIQELQTSNGGAKIQSLIQTYQYYLQMIRDVTGLNEATDASTPDVKALVGLQKIAAANSNTALRHLMKASLYLTLRVCENVALRIADVLQYPLTRAALIDSISAYNTGTLEELQDKNLADFGIFLELEPDEEQKAQLEQNIQVALASGGIDLDDAIDIRQVKNLKLANQLLKQKRKKKLEKDQAAQQANIQAQAAANAQAAEQATLAEMQKQQALAETEVQIEQAKSQMEIQRMQTEATVKIDLAAVKKAEEPIKVDLTKTENKDAVQTQETDDSNVIVEKPEDSKDSETVVEEIRDTEQKVEEDTPLKEVTEEPVVETKQTIPQEQPVLPENIEKLVKFMQETNGTVEDYVRLNADYENIDNDTLLREYYKNTRPHLTYDEVNFLMEDNFKIDENVDDEREVKKKNLAFKEEVGKAKSYLNELKGKYYDEIKLRSNVNPDQQKAIDFFNRYNEDQKTLSKQRQVFQKVTKDAFTDEFKGFDFKVGDKKFRYGVKNPNEIVEKQTDITDFVKTFLDDKGMLVDPQGYHKAIYAARNSDTIAKHFYEQGKADATKELVAKTKNLSNEPRKETSGDIFVKGIKVKAISGADTSKLRIKTRKFNN